mgnify:CR=1 FL=1
MSNETAPAYPGVSALVHKHLPKIPFSASETRTDADITVDPANFLALVEGLKNTPELGFDYLRNVVGIDMEEAGLICPIPATRARIRDVLREALRDRAV